MRHGVAPAQGHSVGFYQSFATATAYADSIAPAMLNESDIASLLGVIINEERPSHVPSASVSAHSCILTVRKTARDGALTKRQGPHRRGQQGSFSFTERLCKFVLLHALLCLRSNAETILHTG